MHLSLDNNGNKSFTISISLLDAIFIASDIVVLCLFVLLELITFGMFFISCAKCPFPCIDSSFGNSLSFTKVFILLTEESKIILNLYLGESSFPEPYNNQLFLDTTAISNTSSNVFFNPRCLNTSESANDTITFSRIAYCISALHIMYGYIMCTPSLIFPRHLLGVGFSNTNATISFSSIFKKCLICV